MGLPDGVGLFGDNGTGLQHLQRWPKHYNGHEHHHAVSGCGRSQFFRAGSSTCDAGGRKRVPPLGYDDPGLCRRQFIIDNTSLTDLHAWPRLSTTPAAQNNNRIRDDAEIQLQDGIFIYRGRSATAASETFGNSERPRRL